MTVSFYPVTQIGTLTSSLIFPQIPYEIHFVDLDFISKIFPLKASPFVHIFVISCLVFLIQ